MAEQSITCPYCGKRIQLTEALTGQIEEKLRTEYERKAGQLQEKYETDLRSKEQEFEERLTEKQAELEAKAKKQAEESLRKKLRDLEAQVDEKSEALKEAQKQELLLRKRQRELEKKAEEVELEVARRLDAQRKKIRDEAVETIREQYELKLREKDEQIKRVNSQVEELRRKTEGKSPELQGEVLELQLEDLLRSKFPSDEFEPIGRGKKGADILQQVRTDSGYLAGTILWEAKRTKSWSARWIQKLKDNQRRERANFGVIVSEALPDAVADFGSVDGIWVTAFRFVVGLATALRNGLIELAQAQRALVDKSDKMELLYTYLSGSQFKQRVEAIVESFIELQKDLENEKRAMERVWAKRERQIQRAMSGAAGMYGDLQGIVGASLPAVKTLELPPGTQ